MNTHRISHPVFQPPQAGRWPDTPTDPTGKRATAKWRRWAVAAAGAALIGAQPYALAGVVFETTSAYHHMTVVDAQGLRSLSFDGAIQSRMSLADPTRGHFEYTEYFHLPWLWNSAMRQVLMIGLGGGSAQRAYQQYYPHVTVSTVELDPVVLQVARDYFGVKESPTLEIHIADGRMFLRRSTQRYDAIIMDAYARNRYGCFIPHHLVSKEFFELAEQHLTRQGVLAYNVITDDRGWQSALLAAVYHTMKAVFPQVYLFPAAESQNVVLIGTRSSEKLTSAQLWQRGVDLVRGGQVALPSFLERIQRRQDDAALAATPARVLTDDFAPVDGLLRPGAPVRTRPDSTSTE
ncbi:MAG: hypothetical protein FJ387_00825 [Verrucomicrobia bacterium]|nr:hypothetical protein [Verrucomicrobiota bacterium]